MINKEKNGLTSSMTAFASTRLSANSGDYYCEIRCVNHRYLDVHFRLPEELRSKENQLREIISKSISRGRVDCSIRREENKAISTDVEINQTALQQLLTLAKTVSSIDQSIASLTTSEVLKWPGVIQSEGPDEDEIFVDVKTIVIQSLDVVLQSRITEGQKLHELIVKRIDEMKEIVANVQQRMPELQAQYRLRLEDKLATIKDNLEENRVEQEMVLFLNKTDVMEELDRLNVHFAEVMNTLNENKAKGRRLDFLMQELNREANTLGSKSQDAKLTQQSVELKVLIEQMREQVQNIE